MRVAAVVVVETLWKLELGEDDDHPYAADATS